MRNEDCRRDTGNVSNCKINAFPYADACAGVRYARLLIKKYAEMSSQEERRMQIMKTESV